MAEAKTNTSNPGAPQSQAPEQKFPSEIIDLPSGGKIYGKDSPLYDGKIEIKYMTAKEEDILTSANLIKKGAVLEKLMDSLILTPNITTNSLVLGDKLIDAKPTFGMYEFFAKIQGAEVISVPRDKEFNLDLSMILDQIDEKTKMIFLASPNNPTGNLASLNEIKTLLETNLIVVVDETYFEFSNFSYSNLIEDYENLIILRSFSKWAGLAGLRIGYAISNSKLIEKILLVKQPYNINSAAEHVAIKAMKNKDDLLQKVRILIEQKDNIYNFLSKFDSVTPYPSSANFILCDFLKIDANDAFEKLAKNGIFVRKFSDKSIMNSLRISAGTPDQTRKLLRVLETII